MNDFKMVPVRALVPGLTAQGYVGVGVAFKLDGQPVIVVAPTAVELEAICKRFNVDGVDLLLSQDVAIVSPSVLASGDDGLTP
jgi:hypothetical protein